ncbi:MAG: hypothetical protein NTX71_02660 [Candidatus Aureabacteria bacterium]|nr:hypothetical protein [Candidatus Auribacterota bacterium]
MMNLLVMVYLSFPLLIGWLFWGNNPGVKVDLGQIKKNPVLTGGIPGGLPGRVNKIQVVNFSPKTGNEIAILGSTRITMLSCENYRISKNLSFAINFTTKKSPLGIPGINPELVDVDGDGTFEIMRGGGGFSDVGLLDDKGNPLWIFQPNPGRHTTNKLIYGDLNKDGAIEFYAADRKGLYQLDPKGKVVKKISDTWISDINIVDDPHREKSLLVALTHRKEFQMFDFNGDLVRRFTPAYHFSHFDIVNWPSGPNILIGVEGFHRWKIVLIDLDGNTIFDQMLTDFWLSHGPEGVAVRFGEKEQPYLAVVGHTKWVTL